MVNKLDINYNSTLPLLEDQTYLVLINFHLENYFSRRNVQSTVKNERKISVYLFIFGDPQSLNEMTKS